VTKFQRISTQEVIEAMKEGKFRPGCEALIIKFYLIPGKRVCVIHIRRPGCLCQSVIPETAASIKNVAVLL